MKTLRVRPAIMPKDRAEDGGIGAFQRLGFGDWGLGFGV